MLYTIDRNLILKASMLTWHANPAISAGRWFHLEMVDAEKIRHTGGGISDLYVPATFPLILWLIQVTLNDSCEVVSMD